MDTQIKQAPSNKCWTSKYGEYKKNDHNLTITKFKCIWNKYTNYEKNKSN